MHTRHVIQHEKLKDTHTHPRPPGTMLSVSITGLVFPMAVLSEASIVCVMQLNVFNSQYNLRSSVSIFSQALALMTWILLSAPSSHTHRHVHKLMETLIVCI